EYIHGIRAHGLRVGVVFRAGVRGTANAVMLDCEFRGCAVALRLRDLNGVGLAATACVFDGTGTGLEAEGSFTTVAQFNTCEFRGAERSVSLHGKGTLTFQNCRFDGRVEAAAGSVSLVDCSFGEATPHLVLGERVARARVLGCRFAAAPVIVSAAAEADVAISHGPLSCERLPLEPRRPAPRRGPERAALFVVTDYGAALNAEDNTEAFGRALQAARGEGGGTVYVPAGNYSFRGSITVPTGVELRGCLDVPHHTVSAGSVLLPLAGRGEEEGDAFLRLERGSGLRGLTVWYPEQDAAAPVPYPWAVQGLGPGCWLEDITLGNAWQGVDFWTHPSDGHVIRYLAGACFRRGLWVSKCATEGWVEDLQFNPHYALRLHPSLPHPPMNGGGAGEKVIQFQRQHLEAMVFGACAREHLFGTFLYAAFEGLAFRADGGATHARVLMHGTDTGSRALVLAAASEKGIDFVNAQLVALGNWVQSAIVTEESFGGRARLFNTQIWAGPSSARLGGGHLLLQQLNTLSGPIAIEGGHAVLESVLFGRDMSPQITVGDAVASAALTGVASAAGPLRCQAAAGAPLRAFASSASLLAGMRPGAGAKARMALGFEAGGAAFFEDRVAEKGGGVRGVADARCRAVPEPGAEGGGTVLRLDGRIEDESYSHVYFRLVDGPFAILPDTVLRYRFQPLNEAGRHVGIDAAFASGAPLRDRGVSSRNGIPSHPSPAKGTVGQWQTVEYPLGRFSGEVMTFLMAAFDARTVQGTFAALFDDVELHSAIDAEGWLVQADPPGGSVPPGTFLRLAAAPGQRVRYTLDGRDPGADSRLYEEPIPLPAGRTTEVRFAAQGPDGAMGPAIFCRLFDVP
ncbi:MAG: chitobiase/beta-hexosaminidase C-terminal domain-containing protein, partial [Lentisphaeria bacterium]|nr:chitobiase/beta-hexosaminidase C-terminal domain-containing protein [Lentisphaeria bacterium]